MTERLPWQLEKITEGVGKCVLLMEARHTAGNCSLQIPLTASRFPSLLWNSAHLTYAESSHLLEGKNVFAGTLLDDTDESGYSATKVMH